MSWRLEVTYFHSNFNEKPSVNMSVKYSQRSKIMMQFYVFYFNSDHLTNIMLNELVLLIYKMSKKSIKSGGIIRKCHCALLGGMILCYQSHS